MKVHLTYVYLTGTHTYTQEHMPYTGTYILTHTQTLMLIYAQIKKALWLCIDYIFCFLHIYTWAVAGSFLGSLPDFRSWEYLFLS